MRADATASGFVSQTGRSRFQFRRAPRGVRAISFGGDAGCCAAAEKLQFVQVSVVKLVYQS
jgi:hypothetical protein